MGARIEVEPEFAATMQQLTAEASKPTLSGTEPEPKAAPLDDFEKRARERLRELEKRLPEQSMKLEQRLAKIEESLAALSKTETTTKKLFDSLHEELIGYRDNFLLEALHKPFIRDLIALFDDLTKLSMQMKAGAAESWRDNLENAIHSLLEVLHRLEVTEVEPQERVDLSCHRVVATEPADFPEEDGVIIQRIKRGFSWRGRILRPEEVVAKRAELPT
jgi:molecular chaperone GrpE (heat shock protein)